MRKNKGFTLIELMVVILIVAILAAVLAPMMSGRIRSAKWSEAKAGAGTIATALRAWVAENEDASTTIATAIPAGVDGTALGGLGIDAADLNGKYCVASDYEITSCSVDTDGTPLYVITVTPVAAWALGEQITLTTTSTASQNVWAGPAAP